MSRTSLSSPKPAAAPKEEDTRHEGWIELREDSKYKKLYFVLAGPSLYCFRKDTDTEPKTIYYLTDWTVQPVETKKSKTLIHLIRERPTTQVEELQALSEQDKAAWMAALMREKNKILAARTPVAKSATPPAAAALSDKPAATDVSGEIFPPVPPFTRDTALTKVRKAEDAWNSRDPERVSKAYTIDSKWRNRSEIFSGRDKIVEFLARKWRRELDYRLIKELWAFDDNKIAVRFAYEWHDETGAWYRSYGNEMWEFDPHGLMRVRHASINDVPISEEQRQFRWPQERRPDDHPGLSALGL